MLLCIYLFDFDFIFCVRHYLYPSLQKLELTPHLLVDALAAIAEATQVQIPPNIDVSFGSSSALIDQSGTFFIYIFIQITDVVIITK